MADYRTWLRKRPNAIPIVKIERTRKRKGDIVFVWKDGEYRAERVGEAA